MAEVRAEFTVEPFTAGELGEHVKAAIDAARLVGLEPHIGPFATTITGASEAVAEALHAVTVAAFAAGASRVSVSAERI